MELRTLRYFLAVANEKNITRAAELLHVTQPTLSRQIIDLENELGTELIVRGKRSLTLTEDGILFKQRAEDIIEIADRTKLEFAGKKNSVHGLITIGATESISTRTLAKFMNDFSEKYPDVSFNLYNGTADVLIELIDQGIIDLAHVLEPIDITKYDFMRLPQKEIWGILVRRDHPFAERESVNVKEIVNQPLMLPYRVSSRREILDWIGYDEHQLNILVSYNLLSNTVLLVEEGMGIAVCLNGALSIHHSSNLRFIPLLPERSLRGALIWKKNHVFNAATSLFIQMIHKHKENQ